MKIRALTLMLALASQTVFSAAWAAPAEGASQPKTLLVFHNSETDGNWLEATTSLSDNFQVVPIDTLQMTDSRSTTCALLERLQAEQSETPLLVSHSENAERQAHQFSQAAHGTVASIDLPRDPEDLRYLSSLITTFCTAEAKEAQRCFF